MGVLRAARAAMILTAAACGGGRGSTAYELWRARETASAYEVWYWGGPAASSAASRVAALLELHEGKRASIRDASGGLPDRWAPDRCAAVVGVATGAPFETLTTRVPAVRQALSSLAERQGKPSGVKFFDALAGRPIVGIVAADEAALLAAVADASVPGAPPAVPPRQGVQPLEEARYLEWSPSLPEKTEIRLDFVEYCVSSHDVSLDSLNGLHAAVRSAIARYEEVAGALPKDFPSVQVVLYGSVQDKFRNGGQPTASAVHFLRGSVEAVEGSGIRTFDPADVVRLVVHRRHGLLANLAIEDGFPLWCASGARTQTARSLARAGCAGTLLDLTAPGARGTRSPNVLRALDEAYAACVMTADPGATWLRAGGELPNLDSLEEPWRQLAGGDVTSRPKPRFAAEGSPAWRGVELRASAMGSLLHPGLTASLGRAREVGATHVLLTTLRRPGERQGTFENFVGPSDADLVSAAAEARAAGLGVLLRTGVEGFRRGGWFGEPFKLKGADFVRYFAELGEVWLHDGLLARDIADGWILGDGFRGTTDLPETLPRWRDWIARLRELGTPPLAYVGSWQPAPQFVGGSLTSPKDGEFEKVGFWDVLDVVGVDASVPLASTTKGPSAEPARFAVFLDKAVAVAERVGRPLVLFDLGYSATRSGLETPWRRNGEAAVLWQDVGFKAVLEAVKTRPAVKGAVVAGWLPSFEPQFLGATWSSPVGRPAEASVRRLFSVLADH